MRVYEPSLVTCVLPDVCAMCDGSEVLYGQAPGEGKRVFIEFDPETSHTFISQSISRKNRT